MALKHNHRMNNKEKMPHKHKRVTHLHETKLDKITRYIFFYSIVLSAE